MNYNDYDLVVRFLDQFGAVVLARRPQHISGDRLIAANGRKEDDHPPPWIHTIVGKDFVMTAGEYTLKLLSSSIRELMEMNRPEEQAVFGLRVISSGYRTCRRNQGSLHARGRVIGR